MMLRGSSMLRHEGALAVVAERAWQGEIAYVFQIRKLMIAPVIRKRR